MPALLIKIVEEGYGHDTWEKITVTMYPDVESAKAAKPSKVPKGTSYDIEVTDWGQSIELNPYG